MVDVIETGCVFVQLPTGASPDHFALTVKLPQRLGLPDINLSRPKDEALQPQFAKVVAKLGPKPAKTKKKHIAGEQAALPPRDVPTLRLVSADGADLAEEAPGLDMWQRARFLCVGGEMELQLPVFLNPPVVLSVRICDAPVVGVPLLAEAKLQDCKAEDCTWSWEAAAGGDGAVWEAVGDKALYEPSGAEEGRTLRVWCRPPHPGFAVCSVASKRAVRSVPENAERWVGLPARNRAPEFRVATYNVLADAYAGTKWAMENLFWYCAPGVVEASGRRQLILRDILRIDADVIGLQEVDSGQLACLAPLRELGWEYTYTRKVGNAADGCALLWRTSRFHAEALPFDLQLCGAVSALPGLNASSAAAIEASEYTKEALAKCTTVAQGVLLRDLAVEGKRLLVANTHLFYHPGANHIRLLQLHMLLTDMSRRVEVAEADGLGRPAVIVLGDLNARKGSFGPTDIGKPPQAAYRLIRDGVISADDSDWLFSRKRVWEEEAPCAAAADGQGCDACVCCDGSGRLEGYGVCPLCDGLPFEDADSNSCAVGAGKTPTPEPLRLELRRPLPLTDPNEHLEVTNFTAGFQECLDYTLLDSNLLERARVIPAPALELLRKERALPSSIFPSDHVPVIADAVYSA